MTELLTFENIVKHGPKAVAHRKVDKVPSSSSSGDNRSLHTFTKIMNTIERDGFTFDPEYFDRTVVRDARKISTLTDIAMLANEKTDLLLTAFACDFYHELASILIDRANNDEYGEQWEERLYNIQKQWVDKLAELYPYYRKHSYSAVVATEPEPSQLSIYGVLLPEQMSFVECFLNPVASTEITMDLSHLQQLRNDILQGLKHMLEINRLNPHVFTTSMNNKIKYTFENMNEHIIKPFYAQMFVFVEKQA